MSTTRALAWNTGVQIAGKVVSTAIGAVIIGLMTRHLGQEGFGMYSTANAYFQIFAILLDLGLAIMLVQMLGEHAGDKTYEDRAVSATFTLRILIALFLLGIAPLIGLFTNYPSILKLALFAIWGSFFASALSQIVVGVHQRHFQMHVVAAAEIAGRLVLLAGILVARKLGWGLVPIVLLVSLGSLVNFTIITLVARRLASFRWNWDPVFWRILLGRSWPIATSILFSLVYFKADTLILSIVRPFEEVGLYGAAYRVLEILASIPFMYTGVLLPLLAKAWVTKNVARFQSLFRNSLVAMTLLAAPMIAGVFVLGEPIMTLIAGPNFIASGIVLKILIIATAIIFVGTVSSHAIVALDAQRKMLIIYSAVAIVTVVGYLLTIPRYGMWAAAWLTVGSEFCVALGSTVIALRISHTRLDPIPYLKILFATALMALAIFPLQRLWLPIPILTGAILYAALILVSGVISCDTLRKLLSLHQTDKTPDIPF